MLSLQLKGSRLVNQIRFCIFCIRIQCLRCHIKSQSVIHYNTTTKCSPPLHSTVENVAFVSGCVIFLALLLLSLVEITQPCIKVSQSKHFLPCISSGKKALLEMLSSMTWLQNEAAYFHSLDLSTPTFIKHFKIQTKVDGMVWGSNTG